MDAHAVDKDINSIIRDLWYNYKSEMQFFLVLSACTLFSHWLSRFILWGLADAFFLVQTYVLRVPVLNIGDDAMTAFQLPVKSIVTFSFRISSLNESCSSQFRPK